MVTQQSSTSLDTPEYAVPSMHQLAVNNYPAHMMAIPPSRMFTIKEALSKYRVKVGVDAPVYDASQGDGGASLPGVSTAILDRAHELQVEHGTGYDKPFGTPLFRQASVEQYWQLDSQTGWGEENIIFVQGGRDGLIKAYTAMVALGHGRIGDLLVVSRVPWISYNWGPYSVGLNVLRAPGLPEDGWRYTPGSIRACVDFAARDGRKVAGLLITSPDNPTGRTLSTDEQIHLARTALEAGYPFVLFDWMYHWVTDGEPSNINSILQAFNSEERDRLIFLDGITKSLGASNIRSAQVVASREIIQFINSRASHGVVPSFYAQAVAIAAYEMGFAKACSGITHPTSASRQVLRKALEAADLNFIMGDGYYAFIDVSEIIEAGEYQNSADLGQDLAEQFGVAVVPGVYFSDAGSNWIRFSYAMPPGKTSEAIQCLLQGLDILKRQ